MTHGTAAESDARYFDVLAQSTIETLRTMAMLEASCVRRCRECECGLSWDAGARMELTGRAAGCIGIAAGLACAQKIVSRIVGEDVADVTQDDAAGGLGEVLNMIAGSTKTRLAGTPYHFELTIPVPWVGRRKSVCDGTGDGITAVFDVEGEPFALCARIG